MKDILKCYVSGQVFSGNENQGIISFAVPEYGILFRCAISGKPADLQIISFLTFLRFTEHNKDLFKKRELHIFTDFPPLVYLMNEGSFPGQGMEAVRQQAQKYAKDIIHKVKWINHKDNRAAGSIVEIPDMPANSNLKIKSFAGIISKDSPPGRAGGPKI